MDDTTVFCGFARTGGARGGGAGGVAAADTVEVSSSFVIKLMQCWRRRGTLAPDRMGGGARSKLAPHAERVHALLAAAPDLTIAEPRTRLAAEEIDVSPSAISRFLGAAGLTRIKRPGAPPPASPGARGSPP